MSDGFVSLSLLVIALCAAIIISIICSRRATAKLPPQTHKRHSPQAGYDRAEIARSAMAGHGKGGDGSGG